MSESLASFESLLHDLLKKKPPISANSTAELTRLASLLTVRNADFTSQHGPHPPNSSSSCGIPNVLPPFRCSCRLTSSQDSYRRFTTSSKLRLNPIACLLSTWSIRYASPRTTSKVPIPMAFRPSCPQWSALSSKMLLTRTEYVHSSLSLSHTNIQLLTLFSRCIAHHWGIFATPGAHGTGILEEAGSYLG